MLANTLKTAAMAGLLGLGLAGAGGTAASAYTVKTRCYGNDCVKMQCNDFGYDCYRIGYTERYDYDRPYAYTTRSYTYAPYDSDGGSYRDYDSDRYDARPYDYDDDYDTPY